MFKKQISAGIATQAKATPRTVSVATGLLTARHSAACLYCAARASSDEHILAEGIGGHLTAPILCERHNNDLSPIDKALVEHYAVLTWASGTARDRGGRERWPFGTRLRFPDAANERVTILDPDGTTEFAKVVVEKDAAGKPIRFDGPLDTLRAIAAQNGNGPIVELVSPGATIPVGVGITDDVLPGLMKTALHFAAGFVGAPSPATIAAATPFILGKRRVPVVPLPFRQPWFDPHGPLRHEVTLYPDGRNAVVAILLYNAIAVALELPHFVAEGAVRHTQLLDGSAPQVYPVEAIPVPRRPLSDREVDNYLTIIRKVLSRIFIARHHLDINDMAQEAARKAAGEGARLGSNDAFLMYFRANLECRALPRSEITALVNKARAQIARGGVPFDMTPMLL